MPLPLPCPFPSDQTRAKREVSAAHIEIGGRSRYIASNELLPEAIQQMWSYLVPLIHPDNGQPRRTCADENAKNLNVAKSARATTNLEWRSSL